MKQVMTCVLAFGSNLGERETTIRAAWDDLLAAPGIHSVEPSPLHDSVALTEDGLDPDAPAYLNAVAVVTTDLSPDELLDLVNRIEAEHGRVRVERWGSRTLDIDIITYGGRVVKTDRLTIPHPRAFERDFVLRPWLDLDPNAVLMGHGRVSDVLARLENPAAAHRREPTWGGGRA
ncbi:2-amino-4-hydroxy-6-hydroxymethyldihydropteridine diphosphokinase [Lysinibacter cavernae]|uniref:2-amino-4-hydroxy-6-hydroxymethyldihydropteridine diphosphokinase n=1 Tax=Lysinibacter cavernae TaxID=1640652 RepID=A0A7X5TU75_9MICO|nr:2-amino-4-hydroxy-6-hydroxymethyldihydropteridine diphosphokinase [Lysinibacter cavernae]NIH54279.1 2-amino-4-hydroxy-6-hydroxymethyldihydropteridine diphosphokinase [Lysinibacter cavernae]